MRSAWKPFGLVLLSSILQTVIFPMAGPTPVWRSHLAWIALVPWMYLLLKLPCRNWREVGRIALWSYLCGIFWYLGHCYWVFQTMHQYGGLSTPMAAVVLVLFCLYLGLYHAFFGILAALLRFGSRAKNGWMIAALPMLWVAVELARSRVTSFPWDLLGYAQVENSVLTALAPWTGTYGISFILAMVNAAIAVALVSRGILRRIAAGTGCAAAVLFALAGDGMHPARPAATSSAVMVQPNLSEGEDTDRRTGEISMEREMSALSLAPVSAIHTGDAPPEVTPSLVLWPEAQTTYEMGDPAFQATVQSLATQKGSPVIVDANAAERDDHVPRRYRLYNSAGIFSPGQGLTGRYDKIHLVPFGEFMPYAGLFSFASGLTQQVGLFDRGRLRFPLAANGHRYGTFICYESIFPDEIRRFVLGGADVLVNLSNDGWYGDTSAPFQHINMARMRAIENRRWLLRDTNTGITASIDPYGTVREWAPRHVRTAIVVHFGYEKEMTFYSRHGDLFAYLCALGGGALLASAAVRRTAHQAVK